MWMIELNPFFRSLMTPLTFDQPGCWKLAEKKKSDNQWLPISDVKFPQRCLTILARTYSLLLHPQFLTMSIPSFSVLFQAPAPHSFTSTEAK